MRTVDERRLRTHVTRLAGEIGERNVFRPEALSAAADYIEAAWRDQGYEVARQWYRVSGVRCANLEAAGIDLRHGVLSAGGVEGAPA